LRRINSRGVFQSEYPLFYSIMKKKSGLNAFFKDRLLYRSESPSHYLEEMIMGESVYRVITVIGSSTESWEKAATTAVETAAKSLRDLRVAEVEELDMHLEGGKVLAFRAKVRLSFRYHGKEEE
jgi:dodecin